MLSGTQSTTSRYIDRVRRIELLSREEEHELAVRAQAGDEAAVHALARSNLRFVVAVALRYRRYGIPVADLVSEGNLGLSIAARKFDPSRGTRFVTYASYWIRAYILDLVVRSTTMVGAGSGPLRSKIFFRLRRERAKLGNEELEPGERLARLARSFGTSEEKMAEMLARLDARDVSLDQPTFADSGTTLLDTLEGTLASPEAALGARELDAERRTGVAVALEVLDPRERYIVERRYMGDTEVSLAEIGRTLGVSRERARQLEARAKEKLRQKLAPAERHAA